MGPTPVFEVKQLKDAYSKLFDWEWRYQLFEQLSKELEIKISQRNEQIQAVQQYGRCQADQLQATEKAIEFTFNEFNEAMATRFDTEIAMIDESDTDDEDADSASLSHLYNIEILIQDLELNHEKNTIVQDMKNLERDMARYEKEIHKQDQTIKKIQDEHSRESARMSDKINKVILSLVLMWKGRQELHERQKENQSDFEQLQKENQELLNKLHDVDHHNRDSGFGDMRRINMEQFNWKGMDKIPTPSANVSDKQQNIPRKRFSFSPQKDNKPNENRAGHSIHSIQKTSSPKKRTTPVKKTTALSRTVPSPAKTKYQKSPTAKAPSPKATHSPIKDATPPSSNQKTPTSMSSKLRVHKTPSPPKSTSQTQPSPQPTRISPRLKERALVKNSGPVKSPAQVSSAKKPSPAKKRSSMSPQTSKTTSPSQASTMEVEVIEATPTPEKASSAIGGHDATMSELDDEFEAFDDLSTSVDGGRFFDQNDDHNGSFFGGGAGGPLVMDDGDGEGSWF